MQDTPLGIPNSKSKARNKIEICVFIELGWIKDGEIIQCRFPLHVSLFRQACSYDEGAANMYSRLWTVG